ncbi:hypothetical protein OQA88_12607 [Cercophora sp. LCS_1]
MPPTILLTGLNGFIALHTAASLLARGFLVRGTLRTPTICPVVARALSPFHDGTRLELVTVPDMTVKGAFDRVARDVQAVAHLASPVSMTETEGMMGAAVEGTLGLLRAVKGSPSVKGFCFVSTISAVFEEKEGGWTFDEGDWNDAAGKELERLGDKTPGYVVYQASKTAAERAFWTFKEEENPDFWMTTMCPAPVLGPPLMLPEPISKLSMRVKDVYDIYRGGPIPEFSPIRSTVVDVRDVAELVVKAIERDLAQTGRQEPGEERYLLVGNSEPVSPQGMADALREAYPERRNIIQEGNPGKTYPDMTYKFDSNKAKTLLGREWIGFKQSVLDSVDAFQQLEKQ